MKIDKDKTEVIARIVGIVTTVAGIIIGVWQFNSGQRQNEKMEFKRRMLEKEINTYENLAKVTGEILVHANDSMKMDSLRLEFDRLYYTSMVMTETDSVSYLMIKTRNELLDYQNHESNIKRVKQRIIHLMDACKASLRDNWKNLE